MTFIFHLACPDHLDMVQNIFHDLIQDIDNDNVVTNNNDIMSNFNGDLSIGPEILSSLKKDNCTSIARAIIKHLFSNPPSNFKLSDVNPTLAADIVCKYFFQNFHHENFMIHLYLLYSLLQRLSSR